MTLEEMRLLLLGCSCRLDRHWCLQTAGHTMYIRLPRRRSTILFQRHIALEAFCQKVFHSISFQNSSWLLSWYNLRFLDRCHTMQKNILVLTTQSRLFPILLFHNRRRIPIVRQWFCSFYTLIHLFP